MHFVIKQMKISACQTLKYRPFWSDVLGPRRVQLSVQSPPATVLNEEDKAGLLVCYSWLMHTAFYSNYLPTTLVSHP